MPPTKKPVRGPEPVNYRHPEADLAARPEIGAQAHFKKRREPAQYRFDNSLAPDLQWDSGNSAREEAEALIHIIQEALGQANTEAAICGATSPPAGRAAIPAAKARAGAETGEPKKPTLLDASAAVEKLKRMSRPFLNWSGKAERLSFEVPTLPLFVHERLSTRAILDTLARHKRDKQTGLFAEFFGSDDRSLADQILRSYEYRDKWVNRLILGDSLVVMNSLLTFENLGKQVQMIYLDPPYGVNFGSNFQPFVRSRNVEHGDDLAMTREPEMVQAYRDTWEMGLHSYLTYMRDRLLLAKDLLHPSGSIFVQISDDNLHHVREVMDEVFGPENFMVVICYRRLGMMVGDETKSSAHYLLWYAKEKGPRMKHYKVFERQLPGVGTGDHYTQLEHVETKVVRPLAAEERSNPKSIPAGWRAFQLVSLATGEYRDNMTFDYVFDGHSYHPGANKHWRTGRDGLEILRAQGRIVKAGKTLRFKQYLDDFPLTEITTMWDDTARDPENFYVVQTPTNVIRRCMLMTTDPGDLVFDPTCGSGSTAFVAEQWGRRWITADTSRVPLALARQRLLSATFTYFKLEDEKRGPAGGFVYLRRRSRNGEEEGGIVPHLTLGSIANGDPPKQEVLVDRPEADMGLVRVTGPFTVEASIPVSEGLDEQPDTPGIQGQTHQAHVERMIDVLQRSPVVRLPGNETLTLKSVRVPTRTLALSAEAQIDRPSLANVVDDIAKQPGLLRDSDAVAIAVGPADGPISERQVREAWKEAELKGYKRLFVIGFGIDPKARQFVDEACSLGVPAVYLQATMDLAMGDLLKNMRSSQVFSVCGVPDVRPRRAAPKAGAPVGEDLWEVELLGLDTFDPITMEPKHWAGADLPAWFLDTDYNGMVFCVRQAFFPGTGAWENLKKALKAQFEDSVWDHLAGTVSEPFPAGEHGQVAIKVIDPRGNELLVVKKLGA